MNLIDIKNSINRGLSLYDLNLRVTFYARVSTEEVYQINSLNNQASYFKKLILSNYNWTYVDGYIDEGISGTSVKKRDNFLKMIDDAKNKSFDLIITKEISRFSRNTLDSIKYTRELLSYGVVVLFLNDNINTALSDSELRLTIMASMAQDEIRRLSLRVRFGMKRSIDKGILLGNNIIYGYDKYNGKLIINKDESNIVNKIFNDYLNGSSVNKIANDLNNLNIKCKCDGKWSATSISRIIRNPKYKGYYCGNKSEVSDYMSKKIYYHKYNDWVIFKDDKIPVIIDEQRWNKANLIINKRDNYKRNDYLFKGKIFCGRCNVLYYGRCQKDNVSYMCNNYLKNGKKVCSSLVLYQSELLSIFKCIFEDLFKDKLLFLLSKYFDNYLNFSCLFDDSFISYFINLYLKRIWIFDSYYLDILIDDVNYNKIFKFKRGSKYSKKYEVIYNIRVINM